MSLSNSFVDNAGSGGGIVGINSEDGTLKSEAFTEYEHGHGESYKVHPLTGVVFQGYKIPFYKEACELALSAAQCIPQLKIIGWDIAIQPDGPIIIEGNDLPGLQLSEIACRGFGTNPVFLEILEEVRENKLKRKNKDNF